jgi:hypothetical protein
MASFAELDENNIVINVIKISNDEILDENGNESEELGIQKCKQLFGEDKKWVQTWFSSPPPKRHRTAIIGGFYNEKNDVFMEANYRKGYILDEQGLNWIAPIPKPNSSHENPIEYEWNETTLSWDEVEIPKPPIPEGSSIDYKWNTEIGVWDIVLPEEPVGISST